MSSILSCNALFRCSLRPTRVRYNLTRVELVLFREVETLMKHKILTRFVHDVKYLMLSHFKRMTRFATYRTNQALESNEMVQSSATKDIRTGSRESVRCDEIKVKVR